MNSFRNLISDFREKKLWPVALILLVALVAVPVLLSSSSSSPVMPSGPSSPAVAAKPPVAAVPAAAVRPNQALTVLSGPARDPFTQQVSSNPASTTTSGSGAATVQAAASAATAAVSTGSTVASTVANTPAPATPSLPPVPTTKYFSFSVDLQFGLQGHEATATSVPRLEPFPSPTNPLVLFLGVKNDRRTVVFLVSSQVSPVGQGTCKPSTRHCELLSLKLGQRESLLVINSRGGADIYNLSVLAIRLTPTADADVAKAANSRVSIAGRKIADQVQPFSAGLQSLSYSVSTGTVSTHPIPTKWLNHVLRLTHGTPLSVVLRPLSAL